MMGTRGLLQLAFLLAVVACQVLAQNKVMKCYYTNWSQYRVGKKFFPENINVQHCTHLVYAFAKVVGNTLAPYEWNDIGTADVTQSLYYRFNQLKKQKPGLKTLLAVGGWTHGSAPFSAMSASASSRQEFAKFTVSFLRQHDFDGLDLDWEYPAHAERNGVPADKVNYILLLQDLRTAFDGETRAAGTDRLMLTAAVAAGYPTVDAGYNVPEMNKYLDYISVMAYDLHGAWEKFTGHNAGLYTNNADRLAVSDVVTNWVNKGASKDKVLVGMPSYGRSWTLANSANTAVGAAAPAAGSAGPFTKEAGILAYYEVCNAMRTNGYTQVYDQTSRTPYAYGGNQWISYDNRNSIQEKMQWIIQNGFAGGFVWAIDLDDFDNSYCQEGPYPLLSLMGNCMIRGIDCSSTSGSVIQTTPPPTPPPTTSTSTSTVQTPIPGNDPDCPWVPGVFRDRYECSAYWLCVKWFRPLNKFRYFCPSPQVFNTAQQKCDMPANVNCNA